jgi:hypothetical protein
MVNCFGVTRVRFGLNLVVWVMNGGLVQTVEVKNDG